jgi:hypothetical protein
MSITKEREDIRRRWRQVVRAGPGLEGEWGCDVGKMRDGKGREREETKRGALGWSRMCKMGSKGTGPMEGIL